MYRRSIAETCQHCRRSTPSYCRRSATAVFVRHKPQLHRHDRRGSAVVPSLIAVAPRKTVNIANLRGGTAETLNMFKTSAVLPRVGPMSVGSPRHRQYRRGTAMTAASPPLHRTRTAVAPPSPLCLRSTIAVQSRKSRLATLRRSRGVSTAVMAVLPPHWPHSAAANTAVMPPMIAVAQPSKRSCNSMGSPCPLSHRCGSAPP